MTAGAAIRLTGLYRHPIKSLGVEALQSVTLEPGRPFPMDRLWALTHAGSSFDHARPVWRACDEFVRVTNCPRLATVRARLDETGRRVTLSHPERPELTARPDEPAEAEAIAAWAEPLIRPERQGPFRIAAVPGRALTDVPDAWVSVHCRASLDLLSDWTGVPLDPKRFRANLWIEGLAPFAELDLIGRDLTLGAITLRIREPVERCAATKANPETGRRDAPTVETLHARLGHRNFGVYAEVVAGGRLAVGDEGPAPQPAP